MDESNSLVIFTKAAYMLAEADTIQKAKELKDLALTAKDWAERKGMGEEAIKHCRSYALEAERKMGEMLKETERQKPGEYQRSLVATVAPSLSDLGLTKRDSSEAQLLANVPREDFDKILSGEKTKADIKREAAREKQKERVKTAVPCDTKPQLILADPPWKYDFSETENRQIENQYSTATLEEIATHLPETAENCLLLLWATAPKLQQAMELIELWGFTYKTHAIWDKKKIGMGYWFRGRHELLLVATAGNISPPLEEFRCPSVFEEERKGHSKKPECVYEWIERSFPHLSKLEMYARSARPGWSAWGNEV